MAGTFGFFSDAGLTVPLTSLTKNQDSLGALPPDDDLVYFGSNVASRQVEADSDPGVDQIQIMVGYTIATWVASTAKALGAYVLPVTPNGYKYVCTTAGTTGASQPTWSTTIGATVSDGSVVWTVERSHLTTEVKLSSTLGGLTAATGGAALDLGVTVLSGYANGLPVYIRWDDTTGVVGSDVAITLITNPLLETVV